jgi:hypothetical protein
VRYAPGLLLFCDAGVAVSIDRIQLVRVMVLLVTACALVALGACREQQGPASTAASDAEKVRVVVVELHGFVGCGVDADLLRSALAQTLASVNDAPDAVVFSIDSGGGMLNRVGPLSDLLHHAFGEGGPSVLGWVVRAESAAALVAVGLPELWMPPDGIIGGAVGVERGSGGWRALPEPEQQAIRYMAAACAARGGHDRDLALSLVTPAAGEESSGGAGLVLTGSGAEAAGLVRAARTLEEALNERFGTGRWEVDQDASDSLSDLVRRAEAVREGFIEVQRRFEIAIQRGDGSPEASAIEVAESYLERAMEMSTKGDAPTLRAMAFLDGYAWVSWAIDEVEALSGEGGG